MDPTSSSTDDKKFIPDNVLILSANNYQSTTGIVIIKEETPISFASVTASTISKEEKSKQYVKERNKRYRQKMKNLPLETQDQIKQRNRKNSKAYRDRCKMEENWLSQEYSNISSRDKRKERNKRYRDKIKLQIQQEITHISSTSFTQSKEEKKKARKKRYLEKIKMKPELQDKIRQLNRERVKAHRDRRKMEISRIQLQSTVSQQNSSEVRSQIHFSTIAQPNNSSSRKLWRTEAVKSAPNSNRSVPVEPILKTYLKPRTSGIEDAGLGEPSTSTSEVPVTYANLADTEIFYTEVEIIGKKEIMEPIILVHGGAGDIPQSKVAAKIKGVKLAASVGYRILKDGGSVIDAVEAAVMSMEDDDAFNAGYGSVLNLDGEVEMEASIQRGSDLNAGAVTLIKDFAHPISLAKAVLEHTPHSMLGGDGARRFAIEMEFKPVPAKSLITENAKKALEEFLKTKTYGMSEIGHDYLKSERPGGVGTVGAVALDAYGRIAVATSTGGMTGKYVGRIGDTPQIGSGTYADDTVGGVSTTGHGESILRYCVAHAIIKLMENGKTAQEATESAVKGMTNKLQNTAGAITLSNKGDVGIYFSTKRMAWAYLKENKIHYGIDTGESDSEAWDEEN